MSVKDSDLYKIIAIVLVIILGTIIFCILMIPKETYKQSDLEFDFDKVTDFIKEGDYKTIVYGPVGADSNYIELEVVYELDWCTLTEMYEYCYYFNDTSDLNDSAYVIYEYNGNYRLY